MTGDNNSYKMNDRIYRWYIVYAKNGKLQAEIAKMHTKMNIV